MRLLLKLLFEAAVLTFGLVACLAAMAFGHADDAPGAGLIGIAVFFVCAVTVFWSVRRGDMR